ncbi:ABC-F family ATP-binding cassette domain-containing protein [uncultured Acetobacteroides sp.]|uniref:ABC-F family ATP-binding cassette domain-containing protein n=1 Tax=uncultured Acetobacteroides sp. TaxID=1760811 RepID=UPI0029F592F7|nr:ABC-F family ATP-binding cassette domain-containing protein [uncultured Acetobacteroides sp.]
MSAFLQVDNLSKSFGDLILFENLSFGINEGDRVALIARNGAGKTTLLSMIAGREGIDKGSVIFRNDIRVGYLEQSPEFRAGMSVLDAAFTSSSEAVHLIARYEEMVKHNQTDGLDEVLHQMDVLKAWDLEVKAKMILTQLKIDDFEQKVETLSGGQQKRVALANVLLNEPDFLILDEPTNHLDLEMVEWLEDYLAKTRITLLMVTHDRYFLDRVCNTILELDHGIIIPYRGNYSYYLEKREERLASFNAEVDKAQNLFRRELEWMRRQPSARGTKQKARIDSFYTLKDKASQKRNDGAIRLEVEASRLGSKIFEMNNVSKRFGDKVILDDLTYTFSRFEKLGVIGKNGTGKSTFLNTLVGTIRPDSGKIDIGETVVFGYYRQEGLQFDEQMKVIDAARQVAEVVKLGDGTNLTVSQFLNHFLFPPEVQHSYIYKLSGGEKRRLYLCTILMQNPNFLILDEPTNDLDIMTLQVLEDYLQSFTGCVIVVSHDRYFMDKVVDHIFAFDGDGEIKDFPGNYSDYREWAIQREQEQREAQKAAQQAAAAKEKPAVKETSRPRKMTFNEKREYERLEQEIADLETEKAQIEQQLNSGALSADELIEKSNRIGVVIDLIDEKSMRWLELSELA